MTRLALPGVSKEQWAGLFLERLNKPVTASNVQAISSWEVAESGDPPSAAMWNPLNTTEPWTDSTPFNSFGPGGIYHVQNYVSLDDGLAANVTAITNGRYQAILDNLASGTDARAVCDAVTLSLWGTGYITLVAVDSVPTNVGVEMTLIGSPHAPKIVGRSPAAVWDPNNPNYVVLTNGASIAGDREWGTARLWVPPIPPGRKGVGVFERLEKDGIVIQDDIQETYIGLWS